MEIWAATAGLSGFLVLIPFSVVFSRCTGHGPRSICRGSIYLTWFPPLPPRPHPSHGLGPLLIYEPPQVRTEESTEFRFSLERMRIFDQDRNRRRRSREGQKDRHEANAIKGIVPSQRCFSLLILGGDWPQILSPTTIFRSNMFWISPAEKGTKCWAFLLSYSLPRLFGKDPDLP